MSLRMSAEEALTRELTARGMQGVSAYRLIPREELKDPERVKGWFERGGVAGVVTLRPVSQSKQKRYPADMWASPNYSTLWGYYPVRLDDGLRRRIQPRRIRCSSSSR